MNEELTLSLLNFSTFFRFVLSSKTLFQDSRKEAKRIGSGARWSLARQKIESVCTSIWISRQNKQAKADANPQWTQQGDRRALKRGGSFNG